MVCVQGDEQQGAPGARSHHRHQRRNTLSYVSHVLTTSARLLAAARSPTATLHEQRKRSHTIYGIIIIINLILPAQAGLWAA